MSSGAGAGAGAGAAAPTGTTAATATAAAAATATGLVYDERMLKHQSTKHHPEQPARVSRIFDLLNTQGLVDRCTRVPARNATVEELTRCHTEGYADLVVEHLPTFTAAQRRQRGAAWDSIYLGEHTTEAAFVAAGCTLALTDAVVTGECKNGVAVVRPPGHHAEAHCAMGFCIFNNVAVAAKKAVEEHGLSRVLIVDWDVHHGNGTQNMFEDDPRVLYFSVHRRDDGMFYPPGDGTAPWKVGKGAGTGFNVNVGWDTLAGTTTDDDGYEQYNIQAMGDAEYMAAWHRVLMPIAYEFDPQLVFISAGFDAALGDPLGCMSITPTGYAHLTHQLMALAGGKVIMVLEGGYNLDSISTSFAAATRVILGDAPPAFTGPLKPCGLAMKAIEETIAHVGPHWASLPGAAPAGEESKASDGADDAAADATAAAAAAAPPPGAADEPGMFNVVPLTYCAHVEEGVQPASYAGGMQLETTCNTAGCDIERGAWTCLTCGEVFCGRYENGHMLGHSDATGHVVALSADDLSTWCYKCDAYLDQYAIPEVFKAYSAAHLKKFGEVPPTPANITVELAEAESSA